MVTLSNEEKKPRANQWLANAGDKARKTKAELANFNKYKTARDSDGTITTYTPHKSAKVNATNLLSTNDTNPLVRGAKRAVRLAATVKIARNRKNG